MLGKKKKVVTILVTGIVSMAIGYLIAFTQIPIDKKNGPKPEVTKPLVEQIANNLIPSGQDDHIAKFAGINSIEKILQLPTEFEQTTALYLAATRTDTRALVKLIDQATKIEDLTDKRAALSILFSRLTDLNPSEAVELSAQSRFSKYNVIRGSIWRTWARQDIEQALLAADNLTNQTERELAAQEMYFAYGIYNGNETDRIQKVLKISPTDWAKQHYTLTLAEQSIASAFKFLNTIRPAKDQRYVAKQLGKYMGKSYSDSALQYTDLLNSIPAQAQYRKSVLEIVANSNPELILTRWLNNKSERTGNDPVATAFYQLAQMDIERAQEFLDRVDDNKMKLSLVKSYASVKGLDDPNGVLQWALNTEFEEPRQLILAAVQELAAIDPDKTFDAINSTVFDQDKEIYISAVIGKLAEVNIDAAINKISALQNDSTRKLANSFLLKE
jgi:hypothetical protein